jgi:subtilisin family serine protease
MSAQFLTIDRRRTQPAVRCAVGGVRPALRPRRLVASVVVLFVLAGITAPAPGPARSEPLITAIVRAIPGAESHVERAVADLGGQIRLRLPIIAGFSATVPLSAVATLRFLPGVVSVSPDTVLHPQGAAYSKLAATAGFDSTTDLGSMYNVTLGSGAQTYWQNGYTGQGVDVALIDSGIAPVEGLTAPDKVINGPDLSFESQAPNLQYLDTFGHGTHMAGIIGGRSAGAVAGSYAGDTTDFLGMAPDARIVSVKVADSHGATDVSQVIAAIDWVVQHKNDNGMNVRVLNLSYGTNSTQNYALDPLAFAAEQAWKAGIFVVCAAGNAGFAPKTTGDLTNPARDPNLLAVGAADPNGTPQLKDDKVPAFSSTGSTARHVDIVAPGSHIVSLRDQGSSIDQAYSATGTVSSTLFRGSGTSQAAAVVSGAAALVIQQRPTITPSQLKALLLGSAQKLGAPHEAMGQGELDLGKAFKTATPSAPAWKTPSSGTGSLDLARGTTHLAMDGVVLSGEQDIFGTAFDSATMAALESSAKSWSGGAWNAKSWSGSDWSAKSWSGSSWSTTLWTSKTWSGSDWSSKSWSTNYWTTAGWAGGTWSSNSWLSGDWADNTWADASWS